MGAIQLEIANTAVGIANKNTALAANLQADIDALNAQIGIWAGKRDKAVDNRRKSKNNPENHKKHSDAYTDATLRISQLKKELTQKQAELAGVSVNTKPNF